MTAPLLEGQFETSPKLSQLKVTHSCLATFIELQLWPFREALYRGTPQLGQRREP